jgi:hypothetical protein
MNEFMAERELTRLFLEALDARDFEAVRALASEDVDLHRRDGPTLHGHGGLEKVVQAAAEMDLLLVRRGAEQVGNGSDTVRVDVPVRVIVRKSEMPGTARFQVRDGRVAAYGVESAV